VDVHAIPAHGPDPAHFHYDIRYLLTAPGSGSVPRVSETRWFTLPEALAAGADDSVARVLGKALARLAG
jgi:hypothetical protein